MYKLFTDGGSRGNPGPSAIGGVLYNNEIKMSEFSEYIGIATNNIAEYTALLTGIKLVKQFPDITSIKIYIDSELVVKQLNGQYRINKQLEIYKIYTNIKKELIGLNYTIEHVYRNKNTYADMLVNRALDKRSKHEI